MVAGPGVGCTRRLFGAPDDGGVTSMTLITVLTPWASARVEVTLTEPVAAAHVKVLAQTLGLRFNDSPRA